MMALRGRSLTIALKPNGLKEIRAKIDAAIEASEPYRPTLIAKRFG